MLESILLPIKSFEELEKQFTPNKPRRRLFKKSDDKQEENRPVRISSRVDDQEKVPAG